MSDEHQIRKMAIIQNIPCITTISGAAAAVDGIDALKRHEGIVVKSLQEYYE
jgi:carbamoyl-phosphate synthase large subunit